LNAFLTVLFSVTRISIVFMHQFADNDQRSKGSTYITIFRKRFVRLGKKRKTRAVITAIRHRKP